MATVTSWVEHLSADEVAGAVYPFIGTESVSYTHLTLPTILLV